MLNLKEFFWELKKIKSDREVLDVNSLGDDEDVCPLCGGNGEIHNENHYLGDFEYGKYTLCPKCFGKGYIKVNNKSK